MPSKQAAKQQYATMAAAKRDIKALFEAASRGDTATVEGTKDLDKYKDGRGRSCLHFAAASGSVDCAKRILELAPQLSSQADDDGATPDDLREAVEIFEEVERTSRRLLGAAHPRVFDIELNLKSARAALRAREDA